jgi:hypothetical protein
MTPSTTSPSRTPRTALSDDEQPAKTRKTASGRVLIHSKDAIAFKHLKSTYAVLLGGEVVDRVMLLEFLMECGMPALQAGNDDAVIAANELCSSTRSA